ncbi:MAG: hypothetical protein P8Y99_09350, partial [Calditrichaceae bacterium]
PHFRFRQLQFSSFVFYCIKEAVIFDKEQIYLNHYANQTDIRFYSKEKMVGKRDSCIGSGLNNQNKKE